MTQDELYLEAERKLCQQEQLLNGQLLRLVQGDKDLFRVVRERLIQSGRAADRFGVGLVLVEGQAATEPALNLSEAEWWLMHVGTKSGPYSLQTLCDQKRRGEIGAGDMIRQGAEGLWRQLDEIPVLAAAAPPKAVPGALRLRERFYRDRPPLAEQLALSQTPSLSQFAAAPPAMAVVAEMANSGGDDEGDWTGPVDVPQGPSTYVPPAKLWSLEPARHQFVRKMWRWASDMAGGTRQLTWMLAVSVALAGTWYWWQLPPSAGRIFAEFRDCRFALLKLQERRAKRSEFTPVVDQYRPRIQGIVNRLKPYAIDRNPLQQALFRAGNAGLLPFLNSPLDHGDAENQFDDQMKLASQLLAGPPAGKPAAPSNVTLRK